MDLALILLATAATGAVLFAITDFVLVFRTLSHSTLAVAYRLRFPVIAFSAALFTIVFARVATGQADPAWGWTALGCMAALALFAGAFYHPWVFRPVREPRYVPADEATFLEPDDEVIGVEVDGEARAYPLLMIIRPHVVIDRVGDRPIAATFCVLCNSAIAFDRRLEGREIDLTPVTARSNNITYWDRTGGNFIQQLEGGVAWGPEAGKRLATLPTTLTTWGNWRESHPGTRVLWNPPSSFVDAAIRRVMVWFGIHRQRVSPKPLFPLRGPFDRRLPNKELVLGVRIGEETRAYPVSWLRNKLVFNDEVGGKRVVVLYDPQRDYGGVFDAKLEGRGLTFERRPSADGEGLFTDRESGSRWDVFGKALGGPLAGKRLSPVSHFNRTYWFAWAFYNRNTKLPSVSDEVGAGRVAV